MAKSGRDRLRLSKRSASQKRFKSPRFFILERFTLGRNYAINLGPYLERFLKPQADPITSAEPNINFSHFKLEIVVDHGYVLKYPAASSMVAKRIYQNKEALYSDGDYGFVLVYQTGRRGPREVLAMIGFEIDKSNVRIVQLQCCVRGQGSPELLRKLRWEKMLVQVVIDWAKAHRRFDVVGIVPGKQNDWYSKERAPRLYLRYDVTAQRMGFKLDEEAKLYKLALRENQ